MTQTSRRSFLRGIVSAAFAASVPVALITPSAIDDLTDQLMRIVVNGAPPNKIRLSDVGNGWYKVTCECAGGGINLDFSGLKGGGLYMCAPQLVNKYLEEHPGEVVASNCYIEADGRGVMELNMYAKLV